MSISVSIPKEGNKSRSYDELMKELLKVRCRDSGDGDSKVIDFANAEARRLERIPGKSLPWSISWRKVMPFECP